jgi:hypothetical protein
MGDDVKGIWKAEAAASAWHWPWTTGIIKSINFEETMLFEMKFNVKQNMIMSDEFKQLREGIENINGSLLARRGIIAPF